MNRLFLCLRNSSFFLLFVFIVTTALCLFALVYLSSPNQIELVQAQSAVYYVDSNNGLGDCLGDYSVALRQCTGSPTGITSFNDIQQGIDAMSAAGGDTLNIRQGTYYVSEINPKSGSAGNYNIITAYAPGGVYEDVYLEGGNLNATIYKVNLSYCKIMGLKIHKYRDTAFVITGDGSHVEIRDNEIYNKYEATPPLGDGHALLLSATTYHDGATHWDHQYTDVIIDGNYFHNTMAGNVPGEQSSEILDVSGNVLRLQITNNILTDAENIGIDIIGRECLYSRDPDVDTPVPGGGENYPDGVLISGNIITRQAVSPNQSDSSIYVDGARNVTIEDNIILDSYGAGIMIGTEDPCGTTENIIVRNNQVVSNRRNLGIGTNNGGIQKNSRFIHNTFIQNDSHSAANIQFHHWADGNVVKNNIFYSSMVDRQINTSYASPDCYICDPDLGPLVMNYNNWYGNYTNASWAKYNTDFYATYADFRAGTGFEANGISVDPLFENLANNNLALSSDSECIDAGDFLTKTTDAGNGKTILVEDARFFSDGYGMIAGDEIKVGSNPTVRVTNVDYSAKTVTVDQTINWNIGDGVSYPYSGSKPDIGAFEYQGDSQTCWSPDLDCNQTINTNDLKVFKTLWGQTGQADLNQDNITNTLDLGIMMSGWSSN